MKAGISHRFKSHQLKSALQRRLNHESEGFDLCSRTQGGGDDGITIPSGNLTPGLSLTAVQAHPELLLRCI